jgi:hypothetical protein
LRPFKDVRNQSLNWFALSQMLPLSLSGCRLTRTAFGAAEALVGEALLPVRARFPNLREKRIFVIAITFSRQGPY